MSGKGLNSQAGGLVAKLVNYFTAERDNGGPLILVNAMQQIGISLRTVSSIKIRSERDEALNTPGKSKPRRIKAKSEDILENQKMKVRNGIYDKYPEKKHVTLSSLKEELVTKHILNVSISTISKLSNLGFKHKEDNRRALMEKRVGIVLYMHG